MKTNRHNEHADHFDLLPFIAILMCVLGCLLLVTMSIAALSIGPSVGEGWVPTRDPSKISKTPVLVEWDGAQATFHPANRPKVTIKWNATSLLNLWEANDFGSRLQLLSALSNPEEESGELKKMLDELSRQSDSHYALVAVRPSGFGTFDLFAALLRFRKIDIGYEPIKQDKPVRLLKERKQP